MSYVHNCKWAKAVGMERRRFADCLFRVRFHSGKNYSKLHYHNQDGKDSAVK